MHERGRADQRITERCQIGDVQCRRPACDRSVDRENTLVEGGRDAVVQPTTKDGVPLGRIGPLREQHPGLELVDRDRRHEQLARGHS